MAPHLPRLRAGCHARPSRHTLHPIATLRGAPGCRPALGAGRRTDHAGPAAFAAPQARILADVAS